MGGSFTSFHGIVSRIVSVIVQLCVCDCVFDCDCVTLKEDKCEAGGELVTGEM